MIRSLTITAAAVALLTLSAVAVIGATGMTESYRRRMP